MGTGPLIPSVRPGLTMPSPALTSPGKLFLICTLFAFRTFKQVLCHSRYISHELWRPPCRLLEIADDIK